MTDQLDVSPAPNAKLKVFLSYSRKDGEFTRRLADALYARGYTPDFDQAAYDPDNVETGIAAEDEWWQRLQVMIAVADVMVFVISPDSAMSKVCDEEIACARGLGKRIIAVKRRAVDYAKAPPRLSALNAKIDFTDDEGEAFAIAVQSLCAALGKDVNWYREASRLTAIANRWHIGGRLEELLLSASDVRAAGDLFEARPHKAPDLPAILIEMRYASREKLYAEDAKQRRTIGRAFVRPAEVANARGEYETALRLTSAGVLLAKDTNLGLVPELWLPMKNAIIANRTDCVLRGHLGGITNSAFSSNGKLLLTVARDATARLWDAISGLPVASLNHGSELAIVAAFSPDGSRVVTGSSAGTWYSWDTSTGAKLADMKGHESEITALSFNPQGNRFVTGSQDGTARVWDTLTGAAISVLRGHTGQISTISFNSNGSGVLTGVGDGGSFFSTDNMVRIWEPEQGKLISVLTGHQGSITSAAFSHDGTRIVTGSQDKTAVLWNAKTGVQTAILASHLNTVSVALFSPDATRVLTGSDDYTARVWDAETGEEITTLRGHRGAINAASFSPDGERIVTGSADTTARLWDAQTGSQIVNLRAHTAAINAVSFSPNGTRILTCSNDTTARMWNAAAGNEIATFKITRGGVRAASVSPNGKRLATWLLDNSVCILDLETGGEITMPSAHADAVNAVSFSSDGTRLLTCSDDMTARLFDFEGRAETATLNAHTDKVLAASFSPDSSRVATASADGTVRIWDARTAKEISVLDICHGVNVVSFSPDGKHVIACSFDDAARVFEWETGRLVSVLIGHENGITAASFFPNGMQAVTSSSDGTARIWDVISADLVAVFDIKSPVTAASISLDGKRFVAGSLDNTLHVWDLSKNVEITKLTPRDGHIWVATFSPDGFRIFTCASNGLVRIYDVSRTVAVSHDCALITAAALTRGIGVVSDLEAIDLLMQDAPKDLSAEAMQQLDRTADDPELKAIAEILFAPLNENCYLSPTQFSKLFKYGNTQPYVAHNNVNRGSDKVVSAFFDADEAVSADSGQASDNPAGTVHDNEPIDSASTISIEELADQEFVEVCFGVAIFRLADGRYHVVSHFAVPSLDEARLAAEDLEAAAGMHCTRL